MCMFSPPKMADPTMPKEYAAQRNPDNGAVTGAGRRASDQQRAATKTILTSGSGVTQGAQTQGKTLLGQ